jgi:hypothetical protein
MFAKRVARAAEAAWEETPSPGRLEAFSELRETGPQSGALNHDTAREDLRWKSLCRIP